MFAPFAICTFGSIMFGSPVKLSIMPDESVVKNPVARSCKHLTNASPRPRMLRTADAGSFSICSSKSTWCSRVSASIGTSFMAWGIGWKWERENSVFYNRKIKFIMKQFKKKLTINNEVQIETKKSDFENIPQSKIVKHF